MAGDVVLLLIALGMMAITVVTKIVTIRLLRQMQGQITTVKGDRRYAFDQLKAAQAQHMVAVQNKRLLEQKAAKFDKKIRLRKREFLALYKEQERRGKKAKDQRGQLVRDPLMAV